MRQQRLTQAHLERINIGRRYWTAEIRNIPTSDHAREAKEYADNIRTGGGEPGLGLYIYGGNGAGKTYMACALLKEVVRAGGTAYCVLADVLRTVYIDRTMFDPDESVVERVETVEVLLIEDVGKEYVGKGSGWAQMCFENLLRKRDRELKPTIVTTNLSPQAFKERYHNSAMSLVLGSMKPVYVGGEDIRRRMAERRK